MGGKEVVEAAGEGRKRLRLLLKVGKKMLKLLVLGKKKFLKLPMLGRKRLDCGYEWFVVYGRKKKKKKKAHSFLVSLFVFFQCFYF